MKNDIAALTDQITDALNNFAGTAAKAEARRGYKQARAKRWSRRSTICRSDGSAMMGAAQDAALVARGDAGRRHYAAPAGDRWPCARHRLPDRPDLAQVTPSRAGIGGDQFRRRPTATAQPPGRPAAPAATAAMIRDTLFF